MCLCTVYLARPDRREQVAEEAAMVLERGGTVEVHSLFGSVQTLRGWRIAEVDLLENYVMLRPDGADAEGRSQRSG